MNAKEFADLLTGREYPFDLDATEELFAKASGLVVVFGSSDDLMEFRGAISDEVGAYDGTTVQVTPSGLVPDYKQIDEGDKDAMRAYFQVEGQGMEIEALWCGEGGYSWTFKTDIPHATFEIVEDGEPYCRGIVFVLADTAKAVEVPA